MRDRILDDFTGAWRLTKQITQVGQPDAVFRGKAVWRADAGGLIYEEHGQLSLPDTAPLEARRRDYWRAPLEVYFEDGRFFHAVPPGGGDVHHDCAPDVYHGQYDFAAWPVFTVTWRVTGPRKDYTSVSTYMQEDAVSGK